MAYPLMVRAGVWRSSSLFFPSWMSCKLLSAVYGEAKG